MSEREQSPGERALRERMKANDAERRRRNEERIARNAKIAASERKSHGGKSA